MLKSNSSDISVDKVATSSNVQLSTIYFNCSSSYVIGIIIIVIIIIIINIITTIIIINIIIKITIIITCKEGGAYLRWRDFKEEANSCRRRDTA